MILIIVVFCLFTLCVSGEDVYRQVFDLPEGSNCSWNGLNGTCTNLNNCSSVRNLIKLRMHPPICSFQERTPIVCCVIYCRDPAMNFGVRLRFNQSGSKAKDNCLNYLNTLNYPCSLNEDRSLPALMNCYEVVLPAPLVHSAKSHSLKDATSKQKRQVQNQNDHASTVWPPFFYNIRELVGHAEPAFRNQYPHMALLGYGDDTKTAQWMCGGSVISDKFILTAGHCISSPRLGPVKFVALGILKRSDPFKYWQTHNVKRIIPHPEYQPPSKYNDIALLETEKTIIFSSFVLPACLHLEPESNETADVTGWGALGYRQGLADTLQTVELHRYDEEKCSQLYPQHRLLLQGYNHSTQMCYGDKDVAKDTCEGDSGGPLQVANELLRCAYTVIGVTSYGRQCDIVPSSGMYTRVYHYVPWIESVVWP